MHHCHFIPEHCLYCVAKELQLLPQKHVSCRLATYTVAPSHSSSRSPQAARLATIRFVNVSEAATHRPAAMADSNSDNITNGIVTLSFQRSSGRITQLVNKQANRSVDLGIDFVTYLAGKAELDGTTGPPSGV